MGRIICILFHNARNRIAKLISEEEREKLARICKEEAEKISKKSYEIIKNTYELIPTLFCIIFILSLNCLLYLIFKFLFYKVR